MSTMGEKIAQLRKEKGMTQKELARQMNVTDKAVSKWERDLSCPDINAVPRLAQVLGVSVEELLNVSPKEKKQWSLFDTVVGLVAMILAAWALVLCGMGKLESELEMVVGLLGIAVFLVALEVNRIFNL